MSTISLRVENKVDNQLEELAKATGRTKSYLVKEAINEYLAHEIWQVSETQKAVLEADQKEFASETEVNAVFNQWTK